MTRASVDTERGLPELQAFLDRYAAARAGGDVEAVVEMWQPPAFWLGDPDVHAISSNEEVRWFFSGASGHHAAGAARCEILDLHWPNQRVAIVEARCGGEVATYTLRRNEKGELKLRVAVLHGAVVPLSAR